MKRKRTTERLPMGLSPIGHPTLRVLAVDIGAGGLGIIVSKEVAVDDILLLRAELEDETVDLRCRVRHVAPHPLGFRVGLQWSPLSRKSAMLFLDFLVRWAQQVGRHSKRSA